MDMFEHLTLNWQFFLAVILIAVAGYLLGSINFAIITTKVKVHEDIRDHGSGNAGMTNVLRTLGKAPAAIVLVGDFLKGAAAVGFGLLLGLWLMGPEVCRLGGYIGCLFALFGHLFPVFHQFKGGKGILVSAGAVLVLDPIIFCVVVLTFAIVVALSKTVSLASISAAVVLPVSMLVLRLLQNGQDIIFEVVFCCVIAALVIVMHRQNIVRLVHGTENKFGKKKQG